MLQVAVDWIFYSLLGLSAQSRTVAAFNFFVYDSLKILLLLFGMIAAIGCLRTYLSQEKLRVWLSHRKRSHFIAALFGSVTPFCSCSSIPIFISLIQAGVPLGVAITFLVTSPLINEYLVVLMIGSFGFKIAFAYVVSGILIGMTSGMILGALKLEKYLVPDISFCENKNSESKFNNLTARFQFGIHEAISIVRKLWPWILTGVGVGALIHNYVPQELIQSTVQKSGFLSVPIATILGVPMYGSCAAIVPIALVLFQKGVPLGTALSFMMAVSALSFPEAIMLKRVMRVPLIAIFFGMTTIAIILTGYLFNGVPFLAGRN